MKLFPFDPSKAQTVTNPDGFPVYWQNGDSAKDVCVFPCEAVAVIWTDGNRAFYVPGSSQFGGLRLGPKPGKTVYLNCWEDHGDNKWETFETEDAAKKDVFESCYPYKYAYIAIPVVGSEIEP